MNAKTVTLELPVEVYSKLTELAEGSQTDVSVVIERLVERARQEQGWLRDLRELRYQIRTSGGLQIGSGRQEVVDKLRETRQAIFEAEYAHLYR